MNPQPLSAGHWEMIGWWLTALSLIPTGVAVYAALSAKDDAGTIQVAALTGTATTECLAVLWVVT